MYKKKVVVLYCFQMDCFDVSKLVTFGVILVVGESPV